jgi:hypothetical protein
LQQPLRPCQSSSSQLPAMQGQERSVTWSWHLSIDEKLR